jgi:hypothetical protein
VGSGSCAHTDPSPSSSPMRSRARSFAAGIILDLPFPKCLWRRMLSDDITATLADLAEIDLEVANGLKTMLAFEGDVESTFCLTFTHDYRWVCSTLRTYVHAWCGPPHYTTLHCGVGSQHCSM